MINKSFSVLDNESCTDYITHNALSQKKKIDENERDKSMHKEISIDKQKAVNEGTPMILIKLKKPIDPMNKAANDRIS